MQSLRLPFELLILTLVLVFINLVSVWYDWGGYHVVYDMAFTRKSGMNMQYYMNTFLCYIGKSGIWANSVIKILNFSMNYDEYHMRDIHDNDINNSILAISMELVWEEFAEINCPSLISATHQYVRLQVGDHIWRVEGRLHDCCQPADRVCTTPLWTSHRKTPLHLVQIPGELTYHRPTSV